MHLTVLFPTFLAAMNEVELPRVLNITFTPETY